MDAAAEFSKRHGIQLKGAYPSSSELETHLREFFKSKDEFYGPNVNVDGYEHPHLWERPFMIRAFPYNRAQQSTGTNGGNAGELVNGAVTAAGSN